MKVVPFLLGALLLVGCTTEEQFKSQLEKTLEENPDILVKVIEKHPAKVIEALNKAVRNAQEELAKKKKEEEEEELKKLYDKPLEPIIRSDEAIRGSKDGQIVLVEYSDFECPFCSRAFNTVSTLLEKYEGKIKFVYKHLPLNFHPNAMLASQYYEAIRLQDEKKAWKFHDDVLKNQRSLRNGEPFLKKMAQQAGADMKKLAKDVASEEVKKRIEEDMKEAAKFGFQGTPGFLLNGIPVKGAYPISHFEGILDELKKRGKINL